MKGCAFHAIEVVLRRAPAGEAGGRLTAASEGSVPRVRSRLRRNRTLVRPCRTLRVRYRRPVFGDWFFRLVAAEPVSAGLRAYMALATSRCSPFGSYLDSARARVAPAAEACDAVVVSKTTDLDYEVGEVDVADSIAAAKPDDLALVFDDDSGVTPIRFDGAASQPPLIPERDLGLRSMRRDLRKHAG